MKTVYLAGPILGCTGSEAKDWRKYVADALGKQEIRGVSPLRCEPRIGKRYSAQYSDPKFGTARAIGAKNMFDVRECDITLAYIPKPPLTFHGVVGIHSLGTVTELAWAAWERKPTILVSNDPFILAHPILSANAGWLLETLDEAIEVCVGVLGGYTIGGKYI